jgi:hypothetical protein
MPAIIPARPADTSPEAEQVQIDLIRLASVPRRLQLAFSLSATVITMARQALCRAHPAESQQEINVRFAELHYGAEVADALRSWLAERAAAAYRS